MSFGIGMARMASSLSRALGAEVDVSVHYAGPYDPATRKKKRGGPLTTTGRAVIGEYREDEFGEHVKRTDVPVYLPALDFTKPSNGDEIEVAGRKLRVIGVSTTYAADTAALYKVQARQ